MLAFLLENSGMVPGRGRGVSGDREPARLTNLLALYSNHLKCTCWCNTFNTDVPLLFHCRGRGVSQERTSVTASAVPAGGLSHSTILCPTYAF